MPVIFKATQLNLHRSLDHPIAPSLELITGESQLCYKDKRLGTKINGQHQICMHREEEV